MSLLKSMRRMAATQVAEEESDGGEPDHFIVVSHGNKDPIRMRVVGRTAQEIFDELKPTWNLSDKEEFNVNGVKVSGDYKLTENDTTFEFVKFGGEKGN
ncbi:hypothetical protein L0Y49_04330 [bacterium]|nr:hypothetical protein [bacterium]MCI0566491.1 hypothetical protein [bacterium]